MMIRDIVDRLRDPRSVSSLAGMLQEAADEIERLRFALKAKENEPETETDGDDYADRAEWKARV